MVLDEQAKQFLIDKGYNPDFGARPLRRAIEQNVEDPISEEILRGGYNDNTQIVVTVKGEKASGPDEEDTRHLYFEGQGQKEHPQAEEEPAEEVHEGT